MWEWLCPGLAILAAGTWLAFRVRSASRTFADGHILEVAQGIGPLKQAAITLLDQEIASPEDPRILRTGAGLVLLHTAGIRNSGTWVHHASVSIPGAYTAGAVGQTFILHWARLLCLPYDRLTLTFSDGGVYHAELELTAEEQQAPADRAVEVPAQGAIREFYGELLEARELQHWTRTEPNHLRQPGDP